MPGSISDSTLNKFTTFGDLLRFLRRRIGLTQIDLAIAVGYSESQISRLEQNKRIPDPPMVEARFSSALYLQDEPHAVARLLELASTVKREDAPVSGMCPYKGLDYFDETDADLFFGREALTEKLTTQVLTLVFGNNHTEVRFFAIVGASGSGKSSLARAGLLPALLWNKASANWTVRVLTPTAHPIENLAVTLLQDNASFANSSILMDDLRAEPHALGYYIRHGVLADNTPYCLLVIDQFEELFTLCRFEEEREIFITNLLTAAEEVDGQVIVVITLRADFYSHCAKYKELRQVLSTHQEYIGSMSLEEMRRAIELPAQHGHWEFEPGLVDLILRDVGEDPGALPLLSHALLETWERRHARTMTLGGYISTGGVRGAIAETAEAVFRGQFSPDQQVIARRIFLRLTELGDESTVGDTRRRVSYSELILRSEEAEAIRYVLKTLADARLVTTSEDTVQVSHEALIREWPTLRGWLEENRDGLRLHRQLTEAAQEWDAADRQPDLLFRGARLAQAREWSTSHADDLNTLEKDFLDASITLNEKEIAEREAQRQRELEAAQKLADTERQRAEESSKSAHRLRRLLILLGGVGGLAVLLAVFAILAWQRSAAQAAINQSTSLANSALQANQAGQSDLSLALAMAAVNVSPSRLESLNVLRRIALGPGTHQIITTYSHEIRALALSPDGKTAFTGSCASIDQQQSCTAGELALWDLSSGKELLRWAAHLSWVTAVTFSADGQYLVSGGEDGLLQWDINGKFVRQLVGHQGKITGLAEVPGINRLLSGGDDGYLILYDLSTGNVLQRFQAAGSPVTALAVSSDGRFAVSAQQDGSIRVLNIGRPLPIYNDPGIGADIRAIAMSPDGRWFLYTDSTINTDLSLRKVDAQDGSLLGKLQLDCIPSQIELSPDGSNVFITCTTAIIQVDVPSWSIYQRYSGNGEVFNAFSISTDGHYGLSGAQDGTLRVWDLAGQLEYQIDTIYADTLNALAISSDGNYLVFNDYYNYGLEGPAIWDILQKKVVTTFNGGGLEFNVGGVAISPDGQSIAAIGINPSNGMPQALQWNIESGGKAYVLHQFIGKPTSIVYSPDSRYLLIGTQVPGESRGELFLFDAKTSKEARRFDTIEDVSSIAFSADGTHAISGSSFLGRVILWDVATGKELRRYAYADKGPISAVAYGPGEDTVLGSGLGEIYAWDTNTGQLIQQYAGLSTYPMSIAISPNGKYILSGSSNGELVLWDYSTAEELHRLYTHLSISSVLFTPDSKAAYAAAPGGKLIRLTIDEKSLPELLEWIKANRYVPELTCAEKLKYQLVASCTQ